MLDLKYFPRKQKAPEYPLRLEADRQSAIQWEDYRVGLINKRLKINHTFTWDDPQINTMLENATRALGELNAFTMIVPNVDIFIQMHITKEANTSSKIEGTKTEMDEVLIAKATVSSLIKNFEEKGILKEITGYERNKLFVFDKYLSIYSQS